MKLVARSTLPTVAPKADVRVEAVSAQTSISRSDAPFIALAVGSAALVLYLARSFTFYLDDWSFVAFDGGLAAYLRPHNEHWSTLPLLLYRGTFALVGLRSYVPYLAELMLLHLLAVTGVYAIARQRLGALVATLLVVPLLLLGSGAENLYWAFQTGFVGSVTFGVWALYLVERPGRRAAFITSALLVASLMSSGIGLFFLVAVGARTVLDASIRSRAAAVVPPLLVYLAWFALVGHDPVGSDHPLVAEFSAVRFAVRGLNFAVERVLGLDSLLGPSGIGLVAFVVLCAWIGVRVVRRGAVPALAAGSLLAVCAMYGLIALVRATLVEQDFATVSRYVYVTAFFLALAFADLLPRYGTWPAFRSRAGLALSALFGAGLTVSVVANVHDLSTEARAFQYRADVSRAFVALAQDDKGASWMDENVQYRAMPPVGELRDIMNREGSLLEDEFFPGVVEAPGPAAREAALLAIVGDRFALVPASGAGTPAALAVHSKRGVVYMRDGRCLRATFAGDSPVLNVAVDGGARVRLLSSSRVAGHVYLGHDFEPSRPAGLDLVPGVARDVTVPDVGDGRPWLVGLEPGAVPGPVSVCALRAAPGEGPGT